jgi:hypothetical protein
LEREGLIILVVAIILVYDFLKLAHLCATFVNNQNIDIERFAVRRG